LNIMSANLQTETGASITELLTGIVQDAQRLLGQQLALFKQEVREDMQKARDAALSLALAFSLLFLGAIMLCVMCAYLLHEVGHLPLWGSFAIVGGVLVAVGGVLAYIGREQLKNFTPLPEKTAQALEENLEWKTKPT